MIDDLVELRMLEAELGDARRALMTAVMVAISIVVAATCFMLAWKIGGCAGRWSESGLDYRWGPMRGCQVSGDGKRWVPEIAAKVEVSRE